MALLCIVKRPTVCHTAQILSVEQPTLVGPTWICYISRLPVVCAAPRIILIEHWSARISDREIGDAKSLPVSLIAPEKKQGGPASGQAPFSVTVLTPIHREADVRLQ